MVTKSFVKRHISVFGVLGIVALLLLSACSTGGTTTTPPPTSTITTASATLKHVPHGTVDLDWNPSTQMLTAKFSLVGLAPKSTHPAHIHAGSCKNQGNVVYPLPNVVADAHGVATMSGSISLPTGIPATGFYVNVHNGPGLSTNDQFLPIVCGDISNPNHANTVQVTMQGAPPASAGETVSGTAHLSLSGNTLTVTLMLSGLEPNSSHAAHIHLGSCESQGPVKYPLKTVTADASGKATVTTVIPDVASIPSTGWYVNVHHSTALTTQTGFDPIACGNVVLG